MDWNIVAVIFAVIGMGLTIMGYLHSDIKSLASRLDANISRIDARIEANASRIDQLYQMFIDLLTESKKGDK